MQSHGEVLLQADCALRASVVKMHFAFVETNVRSHAVLIGAPLHNGFLDVGARESFLSSAFDECGKFIIGGEAQTD